MPTLAILGASGHGKVLADIAELNGYKKIIFFDDAWPEKSQLDNWQISGDSDVLIARLSEFSACIVAIGNNAIRIKKQREQQKFNANIVSLIHPNAVVSRYASIASGTVVMANAVINAGAKIGQGCIVNTAATIDHDCIIADGVHISPGANLAGNISVGECSWLGIGCSVKQGIMIGTNVTIGVGAAVVNNIQDKFVVVGVPAKPLI
ncbi:acetyltransferase [Aliivibrio salmonicida]|uniref:acetyltransferase n=1 Tax=Aliivibrio salmonicida TaxID=40269 RepID=UPI00406CE19E